MDYFFAGLLSGILGIAELIARYRDEPEAIFRLGTSYLYILFNVFVGLSALYAIRVVAPDGLAVTETTLEEEKLKLVFYQILIAGFGGAAFFRTAIAKTKVGDMEIGVGPSFVIDTFLGTTDRAIDRQRAESRTSTIPEKMRSIPPQFAAVDLTDFCVAALQNLPAEHEKTLKTRTASFASSPLDDNVKSMLIGFTITEYVGPKVLFKSIEQLADEIAAARDQQTDEDPPDDDEPSAGQDLLLRVQGARAAGSGSGDQQPPE